MSRVHISKLPSLRFSKSLKTYAKRSQQRPQLNCIGAACELFTPDNIRCDNMGMNGPRREVEWKCDTALPDSLRLGRTDVSCEGFAGPEDEFVLRGSCSLNYTLVRVPRPLRSDGTFIPNNAGLLRNMKYWLNMNSATVFMVIWISILLVIIFSFVKSWWRKSRAASLQTVPVPGSGWSTPNAQTSFHASPPYSPSHANFSPVSPSFPQSVEGGVLTGALAGSYLNKSNSKSRRSRSHDINTETEQAEAVSHASYDREGDTFVRRRQAAGGAYASPTSGTFSPMSETFSPMSATFSPMRPSFPASPMAPSFPPSSSSTNQSFRSVPPTPLSASLSSAGDERADNSNLGPMRRSHAFGSTTIQ